MSEPSRESSRAPGRPRAFDRDAVLDTALELFWKRGFYNTTTRELESRLGINQSSLYNEFGSKQALLEAALDRYEQLTSKSLIEPLEAAADGLLSIEQFFVSLIQWVTHDGRRGCMLINMMAEDGGETPDIRQRTRRYRSRVTAALCSALERAERLGEVSAGASNDKAVLLLGMVLGMNIAARGGASADELENLLQAVHAQLRSWHR